MRNTFSKKIEEFAEKDKRVVLLVADIGFSVFERFKERFPDRFYNVGISEQNMMGLAAGLAMTGKKVFVYSIMPFVTYRCVEQIRNDICYHDLDVVIVGFGTGYSYGSAGFSHHGTEDIGCLKSIPNLTILSPSDPEEVRQLLDCCMKYKHPVYLRLGRSNEPTFNKEKNLAIGKAYYIVKGTDNALISHGNIMEEVMKAHSILNQQGIKSSVISCPTIKPLDEQFFKEVFRTHKHIFVIEEHNRIGGLGESFGLIGNNPITQIAINDFFMSQAGDQAYLRKVACIDSENIVKIVKRVSGSKN
jgi:transketolase